MVVLGIVIGVFALIVMFFMLPGSKTKREFEEKAETLIVHAQTSEEVFTLEDIAHLPLPVQKFFTYCNIIGKPKMSYMRASFKDVDFSLGRGKPTIKIDYTQYNGVKIPERLAYIDSSLYGIPFQGLDTYLLGKGSMKGVLAKSFTLFDQTGAFMDSACLVTILAESLFIPAVALQSYISWEDVDDTHAKATISYYGIECSGLFTFSNEGLMLSFTTNDRRATGMDGSSQAVPWTAMLSDYSLKNGVLLPTVLQAVWNYSEGDLLYFDGRNVEIEYFN